MKTPFVWVLALLLCACTHPQALYLTHPRLAPPASTAPPSKVTLLFGDVRVMEVSAGNVPEVVESWTQLAKDHLSAGLHTLASTKGWQWSEPPTLTSSEQQALEQHLLLYGRLVDNLYAQATPSADVIWQNRAKAFHYPLGEGLQFIREKTGADIAIIVYAYDQISTKGRKATMALSAVLGALSGSYVLPGATAIFVGMVDLTRGELLWVGYQVDRGQHDLRERHDVEQMLAMAFREYPQVRVGQ